MRELNECTAEVFRRSDERIKRTKKVRKRVLTVCVPLCLFAMVMSAALLPPVLGTKKSDYDTSNGSYYCSFVKAEIKGTDGSRKVDDVLEVIDIYFTVYDMFNDGEEKAEPSLKEDVLSGGTAEEYLVGAEYGADFGFAKYEYNIIFYTAWGDEAVYTLCGNALTDNATGETLTLTDEQTETLLRMIGAKE